MSKIEFEAGAITVILRDAAKPMKIPTLLIACIGNPNIKPTAKQRKELEAFMLANMDSAGWENPSGKAWTLKPRPGRPAQQYITGMEPEVDEHVDPLAREFVALRADAQKALDERDGAKERLKVAMDEREMNHYQFIDDAGDKVQLTLGRATRLTVSVSKSDE
jgi:hypothetical protein